MSNVPLLKKEYVVWICKDCNTIYVNYDVDYCLDCKNGLEKKIVVIKSNVVSKIKEFKKALEKKMVDCPQGWETEVEPHRIYKNTLKKFVRLFGEVE